MGRTQDRERFSDRISRTVDCRRRPQDNSYMARKTFVGRPTEICWGPKYSFADHRHSRRDRSYSLEPYKQFSRGLHNPNSQLEQCFIKYNCTPPTRNQSQNKARTILERIMTVNATTQQSDLGGNFTLPNTSMTLKRIGYGAMQLAGPQVYGPPRDVDTAISVLRKAVSSGVNHIDTSDYYGPHITNQIIKQALHPYPDDLVIVTKVGARRGTDKSWIPARSPQELIEAVHDNLRNLGLDAIDVVNLRVGGMMTPAEESIEEQLTALAELKQNGLIRELGLSNVIPTPLAEAQAITPIVCI